jgi:exosortase
LKRFALFVLPLLVAYGATLVWVWDSWMLPESYYAHGPLVPAVAAAVVWQRRTIMSARPLAFDGRGWWLLGPALAMHGAGAALTVDSLSAASLVLAVPGAAWLACGPARLRGLWPVLGLTVFAVPLPMFVSGRLAFELKEIAVDAGLAVAGAVGFGGVRQGSLLRLPDGGALEVADACGGLRSLVALTLIAYCVVFFFGRPRGARLLLLALAVPLALVCNVLRIAALCLIGQHYGAEVASGTLHDVVNGTVYATALLVVLLLDRALSRRSGAS